MATFPRTCLVCGNINKPHCNSPTCNVGRCTNESCNSMSDPTGRRHNPNGVKEDVVPVDPESENN